ncbi:MAG: 6-hydroxymethylpterin diphosphokinase MptE-like protein, partial [Opitutales bacterium]
VVVGAGPSLDVTLPLIKEGFDRPLVIAADSALQALLSHGISPDFVVNIDPEKSLQSCGSPAVFPGIAILSSQSHPSWREAWGENVRYLSGRVLTEDWLAQKGVEKTALHAINNAGLPALLLADFLGSGAIMLLGMDLSSESSDKPRYAKSTGREHMEIISSTYHKIPGNHHETVTTPFLSDWKETSEHCAAVASRRYLINLNDRGARLEGSVVIHPDKIVALRDTLSENLRPIERGPNPLGSSDSPKNIEIDPIWRLLAIRCDEIWAFMNTLSSRKDLAGADGKLQFFRALMGQQEHATLLGDYSFGLMPSIMPGKNPTDSQLDRWISELRQILWLLEDALVATESPDNCLGDFLAKLMN